MQHASKLTQRWSGWHAREVWRRAGQRQWKTSRNWQDSVPGSPAESDVQSRQGLLPPGGNPVRYGSPARYSILRGKFAWWRPPQTVTHIRLLKRLSLDRTGTQRAHYQFCTDWPQPYCS